MSAIVFLKSQTRFLIRDYSDWLFKALKLIWYYSTVNSLFCSQSQWFRRCRLEYCTTTKRSKHLCKSWSTFWKFWDFILISHFSLLCSSSSRFLQVIEFKMTSAFVFFINRRDYDKSSSSLSSLALFQKKNYSEHANEYITLLIKKWKSFNLQDTNFWVTFWDDFEEWTKQASR